ncbi:hypothetical protein MAC_06538 [Metarhizium acridum CQMa 102]|uniref:Aminoglycoside phosphotransferase domain-containing protein n=1 Tax=Metarhizium acridum (strain CQMa 102) TaxID=655827 RepID=E9E9J0_METAQ|nr:uncharacterized protein MAC_06538 [Metarhizium acridum CQMa 102]EFY87430.1 hypothetical protein MAC_06538 [Metarhizium acridum CQMa 102]
MAGIEGGRYDAIVPRVYAWKSIKLVAGGAPERGYGWIVMQYMEGEVLDRVFGDMEWHEKKRVIGEIACIFAAFQRAKLPRRVELHGGMTVRHGDIVSGQATMHKGEPSGYVGLWKARIDHALEEADESMLINGWKGSVRERIEKFKNDKLETLIHNGEVDTTLLGLVHNDFTMSNMLYNPHTKRITALLDFDWSSVTHPAHEFFTSFHDVHGRVDETSDKLRRAILSGDFSNRPDKDEDQEAWKLAKTWDEALKGHGGMRPCDVKGMGLLQGLWKFVYCICPFELGSKVILFRRSKKESEAAKVRVEGQISKMLSGWGV